MVVRLVLSRGWNQRLVKIQVHLKLLVSKVKSVKPVGETNLGISVISRLHVRVKSGLARVSLEVHRWLRWIVLGERISHDEINAFYRRHLLLVVC